MSTELSVSDRIIRILHNDGPKTMQELAEALNIPPRHAGMELYRLRRAGIVSPPLANKAGRPAGEPTKHALTTDWEDHL